MAAQIPQQGQHHAEHGHNRFYDDEALPDSGQAFKCECVTLLQNNKVEVYFNSDHQLLNLLDGSHGYAVDKLLLCSQPLRLRLCFHATVTGQLALCHIMVQYAVTI